MVLAIVGVIAGVVWGVRKLMSANEALVRMSLSEQASEASFELEEETTVEVWADLEIVHPGISPHTANVDLPHVVDYVVELETSEGAASESLRCNPFDSHVAKTSGKHNSIGEPAGRSYDGRLEGCALRLPADSYVLRARLEPVEDAEGRIRLVKTGLILRAR
jgi:hypothetical protein